MKVPSTRWVGLVLLLILSIEPRIAHAADLIATFRNIVTVFTGGLLPVLAAGYLGKNIFNHIAGDPNAKQESVRVVLAIACLLCLTGAWNLIASQIR